MKVGFIGLGKMGKPMAMNLLRKGFELTVHNRSRAVVDQLAAMGAAPAWSPREVAMASDAVLTCLPTPEAVETVYLGPDGLIPAIGPGQLLVDHSTVAPGTSRMLHAAAADKGAQFLDAPISGGVPSAEAGTLTIMVGGEQGAFGRAQPLFQAMGDRTILVGGTGAGSVVKLVNQLLVGIHTAAAVEALVLGVKAGADARHLLNVVDSSFGASAMFKRTAQMVLERRFGTATDVGTLKKDLGLVTDLGEQIGCRLLMGELAEEIFTEGVGMGLANNDMVSLVLPLEKIAGVEVK